MYRDLNESYRLALTRIIQAGLHIIIQTGSDNTDINSSLLSCPSVEGRNTLSEQ